MAGEISQASLNLTTEERRAFGQLFQQADTENLGVVTGDVAVKFFERTKLDPATLGEIWQLADSENRGLLTPSGFSVALRLIGHCQAGRTLSADLATKPAPLPKFDGSASASQSQSFSTPLQAQTTGGSTNSQSTGPIRVPPLTPDKVAEYQSIFDKAGARNGLLGGDAAKQMFEKARLPNEVLGRIWTLADTEQRGTLSLTEFIIAMHLLTSMRNGSLRAVPQTLPAGLYEAASRRKASAAGGIMNQFTGSGPQRTQSPLSQSPLSRSFPSQQLTQQGTGNEWLITPQDKSKFDQIFRSLDTSGSGVLSGDQAVQFFSNSGLAEDTLASIWDLADIRSEGRLNSDEFAVAMYLIRQQRGKTSDRDNLPSQLPSALIPPSMRQQPLPASQPTAPAFDNAAFATEQPKSASEDLFGLDALAGEPTETSKPAVPAAIPEPVRSPPITSPSGFRQFQPTSSFGQNLAYQNTGNMSAPTPPQARATLPPKASAVDDLLGDNDPEVSRKLTDETTELANISNQVRNLRTQTQEVQNKKVTAESNLASSLNEKRDLESRLAQLRSQYEQEIRQVKSLDERLNTSRNETRRLQQDIAMIEGTSQDLRSQYQQATTALEADQRENASLKERTGKLNAEISQLRTQLEKMKSDLRQQKGLVAINKKQLATSESERDKLQNEMTDVKKEQAEVAASLQTSKQEPTSGTASPAPPSNNPFFRRTQPNVDRAMSPSIFTQEFGQTQNRNDFDNFFGPTSMSSSPPSATTAATTTEEATAPSAPATSATTHAFGMGSPEMNNPDDSVAKSPPASPPGQSEAFTDTPVPHEHEPQSRFVPMAFPFRPDLVRPVSPSSSVIANPPTSPAGLSYTGTPARFASPSASVNGDIDTTTGSTYVPDIGTETRQAVEAETAASPSKEPPLEPLTAVESMPGAFPETSTPHEESGEPGDNAVENQFPFEAKDKAPVSFSSAPGNTLDSATGVSENSLFHHVEQPSQATSTRAQEFPPIQELNVDDSSDSDDDDAFGDSASHRTTEIHQPSMTNESLQTTQLSTSSALSDDIPTPKNSVAEIPPTPDFHSPALSATEIKPRDAPSDPLPPSKLRQSETISPPVLQGPYRSYEFAPPASPAPPAAPAVSDLPRSTAPVVAAPLTTAPNATGRDDFDSAFDDLSEADEADEQAQDFLQEPNKAVNTDFDTEFESSGPSRSTAFPTNTYTGEYTAGAFGRSDPNFTRTTSSQQPFTSFTPGGSMSTFSTSTTQAKQLPPQIQPSEPKSDSRDWDDMFAGIENSNTVSQSNGTKDPFDFGNDTVSFTQPAAAPKPGPSTTQRPMPGRALSAGTEHDDPILKSLTGMGYTRQDALTALERFDYNIDKAADFLSSQ